MAWVLGPLHPHGRPGWSSRLLGFVSPGACHYGLFEIMNHCIEVLSLSLSLYLSSPAPPLNNFGFQTPTKPQF